jgi:hypothetical protein
VNAFRAPLSESVMSSQPHAPDFTLLAAMPFQDQVEFGAVETAPRFARKRAATVLAEWALPDLEYPVGMIISELVTNSMRATRQAGPHDRPPADIQPVNCPPAAIQPVNRPPSGMQPLNRPTVAMQPVNRPAAAAQPDNCPTAAMQPVNRPSAAIQPGNRPTVGMLTASQAATRPGPAGQATAAPWLKDQQSAGLQTADLQADNRPTVGMEPASQPPARLRPAGLPPIRVWMRGDPAGVYVLVHDGVPRAPQPRDAGDVDELDESGRGLAMIIPEFCAECGWYPTRDGKVTWALIRNPAPPAQ